MPSAPVRSQRKHAPAEERRAQIIEAALGCFSERGYHATTMDDLVTASGLSKGSLYWHFDSKEDVFLASFDHLAAQIFGRVDEATEAGEPDVIAILKTEVDLFLEQFAGRREVILAWAEFLSHPRGRERMASIYRLLRRKFADLIRLGVAQGRLRPLAPESVAATLTGVIDAFVLQAAIDPEFDVQEHAATLWEVLHDGVAVPNEESG